MLTVHVDDDGAGVQERLLGSLFDPFVRSETTHGSTGLGLSVVKAVAEAHDGSVEMTSSRAGTTVTIHLPHETPVRPDSTTSSTIGVLPAAGCGDQGTRRREAKSTPHTSSER